MAISTVKSLLAATSMIALLAGCGGDGVADWGEAGSSVNEGYFAAATAHNTGIQNGEINYVIDLANRFAEEVPGTVNFAFNSAALDQTARSALDVQAGWINQFPEVRFRVFGHTDLVGSNAYNKRLGMRRARAVVSYLVSRGVDHGRLEAVVSQGETQPLIVSEHREVQNRRTVTEVSGFVSRHPTVMNGKYAAVIFREYVESATPTPVLAGTGTSGLAQ